MAFAEPAPDRDDRRLRAGRGARDPRASQPPLGRPPLGARRPLGGGEAARPRLADLPAPRRGGRPPRGRGGPRAREGRGDGRFAPGRAGGASDAQSGRPVGRRSSVGPGQPPAGLGRSAGGLLTRADVLDNAPQTPRLDEVGVAGQERRSVSGSRGGGEAVGQGDGVHRLDPRRRQRALRRGHVQATERAQLTEHLLGRPGAVVTVNPVVHLGQVDPAEPGPLADRLLDAPGRGLVAVQPGEDRPGVQAGARSAGSIRLTAGWRRASARSAAPAIGLGLLLELHPQAQTAHRHALGEQAEEPDAHPDRGLARLQHDRERERRGRRHVV